MTACGRRSRQGFTARSGGRSLRAGQISGGGSRHEQGRDRHGRRIRHRPGGRAGAAWRTAIRSASPGAARRRWRRPRGWPGPRRRALCPCPPTSATPPPSGRCSPSVTDAFGHLDVVFNNAGTNVPGTVVRRSHRRAVAEGGRRQSHRRLLLRPRGVSRDARSEPPGRPDHQQRLDLGARAAARLRPLHRDQARDHRPDPHDRARRPPLRHRVQPDRHRQRRDRDGGAHGQGRAAGGWLDQGRAADGRRATSRAPWSTWRACRSMPTSSS